MRSLRNLSKSIHLLSYFFITKFGMVVISMFLLVKVMEFGVVVYIIYQTALKFSPK